MLPKAVEPPEFSHTPASQTLDGERPASFLSLQCVADQHVARWEALGQQRLPQADAPSQVLVCTVAQGCRPWVRGTVLEVSKCSLLISGPNALQTGSKQLTAHTSSDTLYPDGGGAKYHNHFGGIC